MNDGRIYDRKRNKYEKQTGANNMNNANARRFAQLSDFAHSNIERSVTHIRDFFHRNEHSS